MELRDYWTIVRRRWWIIAAFTIGALGLSLAFAPRVESRFVTTMRLVVSVETETLQPDVFGYDRFYAFQSAEFLVDDFAEIVTSRAFAEDIQRAVGDPSLSVAGIQAAKLAGKSHRILSLTVSTGDPNQTLAIAQGAQLALEQNADKYFRQLDANQAHIEIIDPPTVSEVSGFERFLIDVSLRTALGMLAGFGLVFLVHYLDTAIYSREEAERLLEISVLGEIPKDRLAG